MTQENEGLKIIAICNKKGGVGKTTISQHLFYYLSEVKKKKVLAIDLDAQATQS
jgi:chromosome partitioning protein